MTSRADLWKFIDAKKTTCGVRRLCRVLEVSKSAYDFGRTVRTSGILDSMGRVGPAFDDAVAETFFATLKTELDYRRSWPTRHELEMEVVSYLDGLYNPSRRQSRLDNFSPTQNEASARRGSFYLCHDLGLTLTQATHHPDAVIARISEIGLSTDERPPGRRL